MLTDKFCRDAPTPTERPYVRLTDFGGLYLELTRSGARYWYWKFKYSGKEKRLKLGAFPTINVLQARMARDAARTQLEDGVDPSVAKRQQAARNMDAAAQTFEKVAREFYATKKAGWSESYSSRWITLMEQRVFPYIGSWPIASVRSPDLLGVLKRVEKAGLLESAHTLRQWCGQTFRYGVAHGHCEHDAAHALRDALAPIDTEHYAAVTNRADLKVLLDAIDTARGDPKTRAMLQIAALVGQRPLNVRSMEWAHVDLEAGTWVIPSESMKLIKREKRKVINRHYVPLASQAVKILREIEPLSTGGRFVFPGAVDRAKPASEATMNASLKRGGIPPDMHVPHGFRATLLTMGVEQCGLDPDVLNAALAHGVDDPLGDAYKRMKYVDPRRQALQTWADYLDNVRSGDNVVPIRRKGRA